MPLATSVLNYNTWKGSCQRKAWMAGTAEAGQPTRESQFSHLIRFMIFFFNFFLRFMIFKLCPWSPEVRMGRREAQCTHSQPLALLPKVSRLPAGLYIWALSENTFKDMVLQLIQSLKNLTHSMIFLITSCFKKNLWTIIFQIIT